MTADVLNAGPAVVIPVYTTNLNVYELISLRRTAAILNRYPLFILAPKSRAYFVEQFVRAELKDLAICIRFHLVNDHWLDSVASYNHLMVTSEFYDFYEAYSHLLVAQLDSYVFSDELAYWCSKQWSYIGAPIYPGGACYGPSNCQSIGVGGFSLRNIQDFRRVFQANPCIDLASDLQRLASPFNWKGKLAVLFRSARYNLSEDIYLPQIKNSAYKLMGINEDVVFGKYVPRSLSWFLIPSYNEACRFSLDRYIDEDLKMLGQTPFGAHAWFRSEATICSWKLLIRELN